MLDLLQSSKRGKIEPHRLSKCMSKYMRAFRRAYPNEHVKPKHHFIFHVVEQIIRDCLLLDCFTGERKHQLVKQACKATDNTEIFEKSALARTLNAQLRSYARPVFQNGLQGKVLVATADINCAREVRWHGEHIAVDDVVLVGGGTYAAIVQGCFQSADACFCIVRRGELKEKVTSHAQIWKLSDASKPLLLALLR